ncbi:MAG TPA: ABC transporter permease subunit [Acidimicrobiia bacterium]
MIALIRTEFTKAARRTRTLVVAFLLVGLPTLIVVAINARGNRRDGDSGEGLFRIAQQSGFLVPAAVLSAMSGFLLVVIAGTFAGDSVAGDANWGSLRYLLMRPVPRGRLLVAKAIVAGALIWAATILVALAGLVAGLILFGAHSVTVPGISAFSSGGTITVPDLGALSGSGLAAGFQLGRGVLLLRVAIATAYVAFGFTALLALGTLFSTLTDTAASAIGATIGVYIVSEILDSISQLGRVRYFFPTHYFSAWEPMFTENRYPHDMIVGIVSQLVYLIVFGAIAVVWFRRKDIRS